MPKLSQDPRACVNALCAMRALQLMRRLTNVDAHGAGMHALFTVDAAAGIVLEAHQQRMFIRQHVLQVAVRADAGAEALAQKREIEKTSSA